MGNNHKSFTINAICTRCGKEFKAMQKRQKNKYDTRCFKCMKAIEDGLETRLENYGTLAVKKTVSDRLRDGFEMLNQADDSIGEPRFDARE